MIEIGKIPPKEKKGKLTSDSRVISLSGTLAPKVFLSSAINFIDWLSAPAYWALIGNVSWLSWVVLWLNYQEPHEPRSTLHDLLFVWTIHPFKLASERFVWGDGRSLPRTNFLRELIVALTLKAWKGFTFQDQEPWDFLLDTTYEALQLQDIPQTPRTMDVALERPEL